jgi:tetratricopeptide (TPR) repeat protein
MRTSSVDAKSKSRQDAMPSARGSWRSLRPGLAVMLCLAAIDPAAAGSLEDCASRELAVSIAGCSEVLRSGSATTRQKIAALNFRGNAYAQRQDYDLAMSDFGEAIRLDPQQYFSYWARGLVSQARKQYEAAGRDFEQAVAILEVDPATPKNESAARQLRDLREIKRRNDGRLADAALESRWREYLQQIQGQNDYPNWPGPPYDLYMRARPSNSP